LLNALYQSRRLSGRATLTTQLAADGPDLVAWLRTLSGRLDATVTNGALQGIDIEYAISQAVALIGQHTLTSRPDTRQTPFSQLNVSNRFAAGVMNTESLNAETALLKITGQGTLALVSTAMDYRLAASLLKRPDAGTAGGLANLAGATIPFTITGPVDKMSIRPDVEGLVKGQVKQKLQEKAKDLTQGLFDKLLKGR
jgi:AsmA protein